MEFCRRTFLRYASLAAAGHLAGLQPFGALSALAQAAPGYKALVCVFLFGGNDANNMLIQNDNAGYQNYASLRGPLSIAQSQLLPLTGPANLALNPNMPELQTLFAGNSAALIANVGTLVAPISRAAYLSGSAMTPSNLFSHLDQQTIWQNADKASSNTVGWAGRMADVLRTTYGGNLPMVISVAGSQVFGSGSNTSPLAVIPGNLGAGACSEGASVCNARLQAAQQLLTFDTGLTLIQADEQITGNAYQYAASLANAVQSVPALQTQFPAANPLSAQMQQIAKIIQARSALNTTRQIFFASLGGFDTHANQLVVQDGLLASLSAALHTFYQATQEIGVSQQVTTFTMSDFSRALEPNSTNGTDHAWGSHHIVVGGAVKGGQVYGAMPTLALAGPDDAGSNGRWIPSTSVSQYAATLAEWFGVQQADLPTVLPVIGNFTQPTLGFL